MEIQPRGTSDLRGLKLLVGGLGVLVILGTALVIGVVIHRIYAKPAAPAPEVVPGVPAVLPPASNVLGRGEHVSGIAGAGGVVAVWVSGPEGDRVLLLDPVSGKISVVLSGGP
jgi:Family of unknown function (DUF6476)